MQAIGRLLEQALLHYEKREYRNAMKLLDELLASQPNFDRAWFLKGVILEETGKGEESAKCFEKAVNVCQLWLRLALQLQDNDPDRALACYDRVTALDPAANQAWLNKGLLYEKKGLPAEATDCFRKISPWRELFSRVVMPFCFFVFLAGGGAVMLIKGERTLSWLVLLSALFCVFWLKRDAGNAVKMWRKKMEAK